MRILIIKLKHIGDNLVLTPSICAIKEAYPHSHITVLVRQGGQGILEGCPEIDQILTTSPAEKSNRSFLGELTNTLKLLSQLRENTFDHIFELTNGDRGRWLATISRAKKRWGMANSETSHFWKYFLNKLVPAQINCHSVENDYQIFRSILELQNKLPPLRFHITEKDIASIQSLQTNNSIVIHPVSRWNRKLWPKHYWKELIHTLVQQGEKVVLSSGPDPREIDFCLGLKKNAGGHCSFTGGKLAWHELAAILQSSKLFIGLDTAVMHLAAATQTPIIAIFLPWNITTWHPWECPYIAPCPEGFSLQPHAQANQEEARKALHALKPQLILEAITQLKVRPPSTHPFA
ncbi:MAG: putative lipopolysaccharide heptosyltransferase III [Verrucomicrobiota bacterium]